MWVNKLKIAIIQKDAEAIDSLLDHMPEFDASKDLETITEVMYLFREASEVLYILQDETASSMQKIKKNINFLKANVSETKSRFSVTS
ncbi:hypothetical protein JHD48_10470 [Sulfurimonas sp. SAG-AH-194-I05]|nr:hypothetical protein [Sulfurimonas sp. SAG-AH-194-I05]MDF1876156.1 hypothetical protein [Sulfurimonas sp. SAG-AH-194-I05]